MSNEDSLRNIKLTIYYKVNDGFIDTLRKTLKERLIDTIKIYSQNCILPSEYYSPHYSEKITPYDLTRTELKIVCPLVVNKTKMLKMSGCLFPLLLKPLFKTKRILSIVEDDMHYILKLMLRDINPIGLGAFITELSVCLM